MANNDGDYAYDAHLADWHDEDNALFWALGIFFFKYNRIETDVEQLLLDLYEVPQTKGTAFRKSFLRGFSLAVAAARLDPILRHTDLLSTIPSFVSDLKALAAQRNLLAHGLVGSSEDTNSSPGFHIAERRQQPPTHKVSHDQMQALLRACDSVAQQVSILSQHVTTEDTPYPTEVRIDGE